MLRLDGLLTVVGLLLGLLVGSFGFLASCARLRAGFCFVSWARDVGFCYL